MMTSLVEKLSALSGVWESTSRSLTFTTDALMELEVRIHFGQPSRGPDFVCFS